MAWHGMAWHVIYEIHFCLAHCTDASHFVFWFVLFFPITVFLCVLQAYFKFVPLEYGVPLVAGIFVIYQIHGQLKTRE